MILTLQGPLPQEKVAELHPVWFPAWPLSYQGSLLPTTTLKLKGCSQQLLFYRWEEKIHVQCSKWWLCTHTVQFPKSQPDSKSVSHPSSLRARRATLVSSHRETCDSSLVLLQKQFATSFKHNQSYFSIPEWLKRWRSSGNHLGHPPAQAGPPEPVVQDDTPRMEITQPVWAVWDDQCQSPSQGKNVSWWSRERRGEKCFNLLKTADCKRKMKKDKGEEQIIESAHPRASRQRSACEKSNIMLKN